MKLLIGSYLTVFLFGEIVEITHQRQLNGTSKGNARGYEDAEVQRNPKLRPEGVKHHEGRIQVEAEAHVTMRKNSDLISQVGSQNQFHYTRAYTVVKKL